MLFLIPYREEHLICHELHVLVLIPDRGVHLIRHQTANISSAVRIRFITLAYQ